MVKDDPNYVATLSVSLITKSEEQDTMDELEKIPVPVMPKRGLAKKTRLAALMVSLVWKEVIRLQDKSAENDEKGQRSPNPFQRLLEARFRVWLENEEKGENPKEAKFPKCEFSKVEGTVQEGNLKETITSLAQQAGQIFAKINNEGIRKNLFWNYVEAVGHAACEGNTLIIPFWIKNVANLCQV